MADGQLAINTAATSPGLFFKDAGGTLVKVGPVHVGTTAPNATPASGGQTGNSIGEQWLDTASGRFVFKIWDGTAWRTEDGEFVNASGDVMTGALGIIAGSATAPGLYFSGDSNTGIYSPGADQIALSTGGTQKFAIDSLNGNPIIENEFPTIAPSLDLAFALTKTLDPRITFTRASSGTYVDSVGVLQTATTDVPRFDHDPTTGESLGLLVEEQRTNLLVQSEDFSTTWTNAGSSENVNVQTAPNGTLTADALVDTTVSEAHQINQSVAGLPGNTAYTFSCFMKKGSKNFGSLAFGPNASWGGGSGAGVFFNLDTGTVGLATNATGTIQAFANGWYRCTATATTVASPGTVTMRLGSSLGGTALTYIGDADEAIYLWGAQLEVEAFSTSYTPTLAATVTRSADVASISGSNFSSWYSIGGGTMFSEFDSAAPADGNAIFPWTLWNSGNDYLAMRTATGYSPDRLVAINRAGGSNTFTSETNVSGYLTMPIGMTRGAFAFETNNFALAWNGVKLFQASSGTIASGITKLDFGSIDGSSIINGRIRRLTYWPTRLPDSTLQAVTQ
jgi:hypothetical protein